MNGQNLLPPIEVTDLRDPDRKLFYSAHVGPRGAVICAYAQEFCGDWNTWNYERSYAHLVKEGKYTFSCGDFSAFKTGITRLGDKLFYDPNLWPEEFNLIQQAKEQAMPAVINLDPDKRIVQPKEKPAEQPKRPRGRPRKNPTDQVITAAQVEEKVENVLPVKPAPAKTPVKPVPEKSLEEQTNAKIQAASQALAAKVNPKPEPKPEEKTPEQPPAPAPEPAPTKRRWEFELSPDDIL